MRNETTEWIKIDKGGVEIVHAAIEGRRQLLVQPDQILGYVAALGGEPESDSKLLDNNHQAFEATKTLTVYTQRAYSALSFLASHTGEFQIGR